MSRNKRIIYPEEKLDIAILEAKKWVRWAFADTYPDYWNVNWDTWIVRKNREYDWTSIKLRSELARLAILELGKAFEKLVRRSCVCEEIKNALRDEIAEMIISHTMIEELFPDKLKTKRRFKKSLHKRGDNH